MDLFCALGYFVRVVDTGSFSRVARETGLCHTTISQQITYLEQHFGVRLLHRTTRRMSLTGDGEILIGHARRMLGKLSAMEQKLGAHRDAPTGLVRVGSIMGAGLFLAVRLPLLLERNPELSVELVVCDHINDMVESHLDLALCDGDLVGSSFVAREIATFGYSVVAAPLYLRQHGVPEAPAELRRHTCILRGAEDQRATWEFDGPNGAVSVRVSGQLFSHNQRAGLVMARSGCGIACLADAQVRDDIRAGRLIRLLPQYALKPVMLNVVYPSRRHLARRTREVLTFLIQQGRVDQSVANWRSPTPTLLDDTDGTAPPPLAGLNESSAAVMN
jgi:DNA-binding transcriptional LysR family regulator